MNQELIKVTATENKQTVDARELYNFLESKQEFSNWFKKKVLENPYFAENIDCFLLDKVVEQTGQLRSIDLSGSQQTKLSTRWRHVRNDNREGAKCKN